MSFGSNKMAEYRSSITGYGFCWRCWQVVYELDPDENGGGGQQSESQGKQKLERQAACGMASAEESMLGALSE